MDGLGWNVWLRNFERDLWIHTEGAALQMTLNVKLCCLNSTLQSPLDARHSTYIHSPVHLVHFFLIQPMFTEPLFVLSITPRKKANSLFKNQGHM